MLLTTDQVNALCDEMITYTEQDLALVDPAPPDPPDEGEDADAE